MKQRENMLEINKIYNMDCLEGLKLLESESINCCVTSPPYYGLRDYGIDGQIGLEETPEEYIAKLVNVFREVKRVLRKDGTLWLNIGDCYCGTGSKGEYKDPKYAEGRNGQSFSLTRRIKGIKPKDLIGVPWMVAFALRADGWYLRQDIIWHKPNPMPESVTDRCTKAHEYIFLLSKSAHYYFNNEAIKEDAVSEINTEIKFGGNKYGDNDSSKFQTYSGNIYNPTSKKNKRSVWTVTTKPFKEAHFATYPPDLIEPCILAGCPAGGVVLDPFMGSGTTGMVAAMYQRNFIGFELNPEYCKMAEKRIEPYLMQQTIFELLKGGQP